jgi:signal transduction histidine kinase
MVGACLLVSFGFGLVVLVQEFDRDRAGVQETLRRLIGRWVKTASADYLSRTTLVDWAAAWARARPEARDEARRDLQKALDQLGQEFERQAETTPGLDVVGLELTAGTDRLASWESRRADTSDSHRVGGIPVVPASPDSPAIVLAARYRVAPEIEEGLAGMQSSYRKLLLALLGLSGYSLVCFGYMVQHARLLRERVAREAARDATLDLADRMCHELGNIVFVLSNERGNLASHLDLFDRFLAEEPEAREFAADRAGLEAGQKARFERALGRELQDRGIDPRSELQVSAAMARDVCRQVEVAAHYIAATVHELDLYLKQSSLPPSPAPVQLSACVDDALALLRPRLETADARVSRPSIDPMLMADRRLLVHALINLLKNGYEAAVGAGRVPELGVEARVHGGKVQIDVTDNGPGVPPEVQPHLFEGQHSTKGPGRGKGLAIVRESVEVQGGSIPGIETGPGGTRVRLILARAVGPSPIEQRDASERKE